MLGTLTFSIVFLSLYSPKSQESKSLHAPIIRVNKKTIRSATLDHAFERLKQQKQVQLGANFKITPVIEQKLRQEALTQLVVSEVLRQSAYQKGYRIHPKDLYNELKNIPIFQVNQKFSNARFEEVIHTTGYTKKSFFKALENDKLIGQLREAILKTALALPHEVKTAIQLIKQQRDFTYTEIKPEAFFKQVSKASFNEMKEYYDHHLSAFQIPEQVQLDYVLISLSEYLQKLQALHPDIEISRLKEMATKQFEKGFEQLANIANISPYSLKEISRCVKTPIQSTEFFSRSGGSSTVSNQPKVIAAAFSQEVLQGNNSPILTLDGNRIIVLRLRKRQPLSLPKFEIVQSKIQTALMHQKAQEKAEHYAKALVSSMNTGEPSDLKSLNLHWKKVVGITRYSKAVPSGILNAAFKMPSYTKTKSAMHFLLPNGAYAVICLLKVQDNYSFLSKTEQTLYQEELASEQGQLDYSLYVASQLARCHDQIGPQLNP